MQVERPGHLPWAGNRRYQALHSYLLKGALVLHTLGPYKHPAVPEGQVLDILAAQIAEKLSGFFIHPATQKEKM